MCNKLVTVAKMSVNPRFCTLFVTYSGSSAEGQS